MQHPSNDWNPDSKVQLKKKNRESSTWNPEYTAWNPESIMTVLDSLIWGELINSIPADGPILVLGNAIM